MRADAASDCLSDIARLRLSDNRGMTPTVEVSTDKTRLDVDFIHRGLSTTYWAEGRSRAMVERTIEHSLCFGAYLKGAQVGFARIVSDRTIFAYLMDVYIAPERRGAGIGTALMTAIVEHPDLQGLRLFMLRTRDAHTFYQRFGFEVVTDVAPLMARPDQSQGAG